MRVQKGFLEEATLHLVWKGREEVARGRMENGAECGESLDQGTNPWEMAVRELSGFSHSARE